MRRLSVLFLLVALGCGDGGHVQEHGTTGKWTLLVQSEGSSITLDGTFLRNGNNVTAQQGFFLATDTQTQFVSSCLCTCPAAFSNGIVKNMNQFSGSFAPMVINFDSLVINFSATLSPDAKSLTGIFTATGSSVCFFPSGSGTFTGS